MRSGSNSLATMNSARRCSVSVASSSSGPTGSSPKRASPTLSPRPAPSWPSGDGLMLHPLTVDPELDVRPVIERAVRALAATP